MRWLLGFSAPTDSAEEAEFFRELAETAWIFLQPPPSTEERRRIEREWRDSLANLPREHLDLVARLLRCMLQLQRNPPADMRAELYALEGAGARLVIRVARLSGAESCDESDTLIADEATSREALTGCPAAEFRFDGNGRTLGVLRLWGFDAAALSDARLGVLDALLDWLQDDFVHDRFPPLLRPRADSSSACR